MITHTSKTQVHVSHYQFNDYVTKKRWESYWYQIREIVRLEPKTVLEVGPGLGLNKVLLEKMGIDVQTVDIDPELTPDIVGSALDMPVENNSVDISCAFQVLEHFPIAESIRAFSELSRVAKKNIVISLPDSRRKWPFSIYIPKFGQKDFLLSLPHRPKKHNFDGQHYWELNAQGYNEQKIVEKFMEAGNCSLVQSYSVNRNPYHRFMVFRKEAG